MLRMLILAGQCLESHAKLLPLRGRHRHYSAGDALMIRYLLFLFSLFFLFSCEGDGSSLCLVKGTKILTHQGSKLIETLVVGDKIISYNGTNKITNQITAIKKSHTKKTIKITLKNNITIEGTKEHPVFNIETQSYDKLSEFKAGDLLQLTNNSSSEIVLIKENHYSTGIVVYDLSVQAPHHNYFAEGVLVHNKSLIPVVTFRLIITLNDGSQRISVLYREGIGEEIVYYLSNNANLSNAYLKQANLSNANLSNADLTSANLMSANLRNANLSHANLHQVNFTNARTNGAVLTDVKNANFSGAVP